ncbi:MAG TPA: WYL domain-containing protein [Longimicrobiales bacterium]|nr:WYL domain-containing protein [Longimicrobiales bacterium]
MAERATAEAQLERILYLLPAASGDEGRPLRELAAALGVTPAQVLADVAAVTAREYYHPAGSSPGLSILVENDRIRVGPRGAFERPVRLTPREALALGLGVRTLAAEARPARRPGLLELAARLEAELVAPDVEVPPPVVVVDAGDGGGDGLRTFLQESAAARRPVAIDYLKSGGAAPERRVVHPYVLVAAGGVWYVLGWCTAREAVRAFRLDRILDAWEAEGTYEVPADFDPAAYVAGGRVYRADEDVEVAVRYSPRIARWIVEQGPAEALEDGGVLVRYRVADPEWLVRHVLQHGADAEVVGPAEVRELVREAAGRVVGEGA